MKFLGSYPVAGQAARTRARHARRARRGATRHALGRRAPDARCGPRARMIDVKRLRDEPEYRRGIERKRVRDGPASTRCSPRTTRAARCCTRVEELRTRQNAASKEIGKAVARRTTGEDRSRGRAQGGARRPRARARRRRGDAARARAAGAEPGGRLGARRRRGRRRGGADRRRAAAGAPPLDHATFAERLGFVDAERGAEASGSRFAYLMGEAVLARARARPVGDAAGWWRRASRPSCRRCSCAST